MANIKFDDGMSRVVFWIILGAVLALAALIVAPFVNAILWAAVLSVLLYPLFVRFGGNANRTKGAGLTTLVATAAIVIPLIAVGTVAGVQVYNYGHALMETKKEAGETVTLLTLAKELDKVVNPIAQQLGIQALKEFRIADWVEQNKEQVQKQGPQLAATLAQKILITTLTLIFAVLTMFFMLRDGPALLEPVCKIMPLPRQETLAILTKMKDTLNSVFISVVLVALIQAAIATIAYAIAGVQGFIVLGLVTFVCALIPLLGAPVVYVPVAAFLLINGHIWQGVMVLAVGFGIVSLIDNLLRPFFIGARTSLHPIAVFFSLLGGILLMGPIGLMAGPVLLTVLLALMDVIMARRRLEGTEMQEEAPPDEPSPEGA